MSTKQHPDQKIKLSPVTYGVAALIAALAGYFAVYVNIGFLATIEIKLLSLIE